MASLFKVCSITKPDERKIVKADSIEKLIAAAIDKLKLGEWKYKVYTDDFTEIDEDDILIHLAKVKETQGQQLVLTIVPDGIDWNKTTAQKYALDQHAEVPNENTPTKPSNVRQATANNSSSHSGATLSQLDHLSKIYPKFSTHIQTILRKGENLKPKERTQIVHTVRDYIIYDLKDLSLGTAGAISTQLVSKYEENFTTKMGSIDGEIQSLQQAVYSAVRYQKKSQGEDVCKVSDSLADNDDELVDKPKMQDEYGCVAYLPVQPPSEELKSMYQQRSELIDEFKTRGDELTDEQLTSMQETYYLQRKDVHVEPDLSVIFELWPFFHHYKLIIQHADELLGKNTSSTWKESLQKLAKPINRWAKNEEIAREVKVKNKKSAIDEERRFVRDRLKLATKYSEKFKNDIPYQTVVFEFIVKYMKEDSTFLYNLISEDMEDAKMLDSIPVANPVLVIRGQDLHDAENLYDIVINKEIIIHAKSFSEGLLTTFLCYYVFRIAYPQEIEGTLEAIQRLFLLICPPKGTKRGGKRKATKIHPKVTKMTKDIDCYLADD
ncbi:uncharacterized protein LOC123300079 [Chrysoperla carnea]|uniref:uncharacterized protein LOC123296415 n=1 Tax=Chrysoperla carnea TaxID=189513 RepID=UPI001D06CDA8|nr:uncharacterized protein LOC123296415 [Chrysoperla carnea]XP_044738489.1 uncharacterized protein LOC123300079 [Chrysoperla carnea]